MWIDCARQIIVDPANSHVVRAVERLDEVAQRSTATVSPPPVYHRYTILVLYLYQYVRMYGTRILEYEDEVKDGLKDGPLGVQHRVPRASLAGARPTASPPSVWPVTPPTDEFSCCA